MFGYRVGMVDESLVAAARRLGDEVLFPASLTTDRGEFVPNHLLDELAGSGMYGLSSPTELGGGAAGPETMCAVIEALSAGCLTTTFVWLQHLITAASVAESGGEVSRRWSAPMARGEVRAGVAFAHLRRPDPPAVVARPGPGGWTINGRAPWVTGWGRIDVVRVGARVGDDVVWLLVDARPSPTLVATRLDLAAVNASSTVTLDFADHPVGADRVIGRDELAGWKERDGLRLRANGSLALGITARCCTLLGPSGFDEQLARARRMLDTASPADMAAPRAGAGDLAVRAAAALVAAGAGRSIVRDAHAQRLAREALFLLVQGQTPAIRTEQVRLLIGR